MFGVIKVTFDLDGCPMSQSYTIFLCIRDVTLHITGVSLFAQSRSLLRSLVPSVFSHTDQVRISVTSSHKLFILRQKVGQTWNILMVASSHR